MVHRLPVLLSIPGLLAVPGAVLAAQDAPLAEFTNPSRSLHVELREKILGHDDPRIEGDHFLVSPDGRSLAYLVMGSGSLRIVHDGLEGEPFHGIAADTLQFSPDSRRLAYVGTRDKKTFVVVDGILYESKALHASGVRFSADSRHMAWAAADELGRMAAVVDGEPGKAYSSIGERGVVFSPDGAHYAFVATQDGLQSLVRDGEEGPFLERILDFWWSPDGEHLAYAARTNGQVAVFLDGEPIALGDSIGRDGFVFAPHGDRWAVAVRSAESWTLLSDGGRLGPYKNILPGLTFSDMGEHLAFLGGHGDGMVLVLDGEESSDWPAYRGLRFGPGHTALVVTDPEGNERVVLDGEPGAPHERVDPKSLQFDETGEHWFYIAQDGGRLRVVVNGTPGPASRNLGTVPPRFLSGGRVLYSLREKKQETLVLDGRTLLTAPRLRHTVVSRDRGHFACFAGQEGAWSFVLDGKTRTTYPFAPSAPVFSGDGLRVAFLAGRDRRNFVVVDGVEGPAFDIIQRRSVTLTPDGRHVAYLAGTADKRYIVVDDVLVEQGYDGFHSRAGILCLDEHRLAVRAARGGTWILAELTLR